MSEGPLPKTWQEALPYIAWGAIVVACFLVFIERLVAASYGEALAALIIGIATTAVALHSKDWLARTNPNWMYAAALLFVATLILWPNLEEKRWPFSAWFPLAPTAEEIATAIALKIPQSSISIPTADQIAEAVVHKLPLPILATKNTSALAPQGAPVVYVNPLHDARAKWGLASWLASTHTNCSVTIVRLQEAYSEDFAADLKPILDTIGWEYQEQFANKTIPKGIIFRAVHGSQSQGCAEKLEASYAVSAISSRGGPVSSGSHIVWYEGSNAPEYLRNCPSACVEISIGSEDLND